VDETSVDMSYEKSTDVLGDVDLVSAEDIRRLAAVDGPCVSVFLPTSRFGPETLSGPVRLRHLVDSASDELGLAGTAEPTVKEILTPLRALLGNEPFWQHQGDGLALFSAPGFFASFRVPISLPEEAAVGTSFRIRPLLPLLSADGAFFILALAQNSVRLFHATRQTIGELALGAIPGSMQEAIPLDETERHGQSHSTGPTTEQFHGQGNEADYDKVALERYFRAIDRPLSDRLGASGELVVLACVGYYLPIFTGVSRYPQIWQEAVEGNPEHRPVNELHDAAWSLVAAHFADREERHLERYRHMAGTGRTLSVPDQVLEAARGGRVETLLVDPSRAAEADNDLVDAALVETLRHDGRVLSVRGIPEEADSLAALLRY
jgi:Bacterial archaeo-eukaryotic release factor family 3